VKDSRVCSPPSSRRARRCPDQFHRRSKRGLNRRAPAHS
jgi:hypothetical protein